jgi:hypothetical protein
MTKILSRLNTHEWQVAIATKLNKNTRQDQTTFLKQSTPNYGCSKYKQKQMAQFTNKSLVL